MQYKLLTGTTKGLTEKVNQHLAEGWVLHGTTFNTGEKIFMSGDPAYPMSCEYTGCKAQAVVKE